MRYQQLVLWSPTLGGEQARISVADANGSEFFVLLPYGEGKAYRKLRDEAVDVLCTAIEEGLEPGEYRWRTT